MAEIVCFGECMIELSQAEGVNLWAQSFAGDSYNVASYLARLGIRTGYMSAIGRDPFSVTMRERWTAEGISADFTLTHDTRGPGLYAIHLDDRGERSFQYWRDQSAARAFFDCDGADDLMARAAEVPALYLSGITLSLFDAGQQARIGALAAEIKHKGGAVIFDTNYRPRGWVNRETAQAAVQRFAPFVTMALPTFEDEQALFGDADVAECGARWLESGAAEVAVKQGEDGVTLFTGDRQLHVPVPARVEPKDTTGAGDSFNAAYIAARLAGQPADVAAQSGHRLAAMVVQHPGAILSPDHMPEGLL